MSLYNKDEEFISALKKMPDQRTQKDKGIIFSRLHRFETLSSMREQSLRSLCAQVRYEWHDSNETLYVKDDMCRCWYILLSGSVFIQGSMFLPHASFGKQIPGTKRRGCQCLVLEPSEMIAIDYPDPMRSHVRQHSSSTGSRSTLDSVAEIETSSAESSPARSVHRNHSRKIGNGHIISQHSLDSGKTHLSRQISQDSYNSNNQDDIISQDELDQDSDDEEHEDSISLHSESSLVIRDLVTDVLKKDVHERDSDDHDTLLQFTKSLRAFSNMTEPIRHALCKVMLYAFVEKSGTTVLKNNELLDSWSVIINGQVQVTQEDDSTEILTIGDDFGVSPILQEQFHKGVMVTLTNDCQFLCIAQKDYHEVLTQGEENRENVYDEKGEISMVKEKRDLDGGTRKGKIVIQGKPAALLHHLLEENTIDTTYVEDYLLTYRAFDHNPLTICSKLLEWFDSEYHRDKVTRVILLWVNNHFNDFEQDRKMMELLEKFEEKLKKENKTGQMKLFNIACSTKAKSRVVTLNRSSNEQPLNFEVLGGSNGYPIYISKVTQGSDAETKGLKRGDQLLMVNGQNFEKLSLESAKAILEKNTDLTLTLKTNLFAFKEMLSDLENPVNSKKGNKRSKSSKSQQSHTSSHASQSLTLAPRSDYDVTESKHKKGGTIGRTFRKIRKFSKREPSYSEYMKAHGETTNEDPSLLPNVKDDSSIPSRMGMLRAGSFATVDGPRYRNPSQSSANTLDPSLLFSEQDPPTTSEIPEDVIKVFRIDQTYRFVLINRDTTAEEAVRAACKEFAISGSDIKNYSLCKVSVQGEKFVKSSRLPDKLAKLADIPLSARYYLKNNLESEQLLPDENIPELLKEGNYTFLDLNSFEVALHLTQRDYRLFKQVEQTDFIGDLFQLHVQEGLKNFKAFEDLVNEELFWVVTTICSEANLLRRAKIIKHFTKIAHHCKILKNLNSTFAIIGGLGYRAVSRLKSTWDKAPAKSVRLFDELQSLMDPSRNMSKYRTLLNEQVSQPPVIPYIPVVKKDLTMLDLGNDTRVSGLINFEKMRMIGREVRNICRLCTAETAQILTSAVAQHESDNKPASSIYQTLTRRGRRTSFNNARRMYEDAVNARRVKQYMEQLKIETDEDKLMEMSKQVESQAAPSSAQTRRRNTTISIDSPSRSSKSLPNNNSKSNHLRNNSEPQIVTMPTRKKVPVSSLPKFGVNSPQAISKLMSLSEEGGGEGSSNSSGSSKNLRSGSNSSRDRSPAASPHLAVRNKTGNASSMESLHNIGQENVNKNNNRSSLPPNHHMFTSFSKISLLPEMSTPSTRSSVSSSTSTCGDSSSPSSSRKNDTGHIYPGHPQNKFLQPNYRRSLQTRSNSSSSVESVLLKTAQRNNLEQPVIMQGRSGSYNAINQNTDRKSLSNSTEQKLSNSSSSPSLAVRNYHSHSPALILPNHPQIIPRVPSTDSGFLAASDSERSESERNLHQPRTSYCSSLSSGFESSQSLASYQDNLHDVAHVHYIPSPAVASPHRSPVLRRQHNIHHRSNSDDHTSRQSIPEATDKNNAGQYNQRDKESKQDSNDPNKRKSVEQTFLSGSRGLGDAPQKANKDSWSAADQDVLSSMKMKSVSSSSLGKQDSRSAIGDLPPQMPTWHLQYNNNNNESKINGEIPHHLTQKMRSTSADVLDGRKPVEKLKNVISGPNIQLYYEKLKAQDRPTPPSSLDFSPGGKSPRKTAIEYVRQHDKTPEDILEEELLRELQNQKINKTASTVLDNRNQNSSFNFPSPLCDKHSMSFSGMPSHIYNKNVNELNLNSSGQYPGYPDVNADRQHISQGMVPNRVLRYTSYNDTVNLPPPARTSSPKQFLPSQHSEGDTVFISNFAEPNPRTSQHTYLPPQQIVGQNKGISYKTPPYCPKHAHMAKQGIPPYVTHSVSGIKSNNLPPPLSQTDKHNISYDGISNSHYMLKNAEKMGAIHSRSASDISLGAKDYVNSNKDLNAQLSEFRAYNSKLQHSQNKIGPSPILPYQYTVDSSSTAINSNNSNTSQYISSNTQPMTPLSHLKKPPVQHARRKSASNEWGVTDLDKEKSQQAMQVWSGNSSNASNTTLNSSIQNLSNEMNDSNNKLTAVNKTNLQDERKKNKPIPPQRSSSYIKHGRLSSSTLSPPSSPNFDVSDKEIETNSHIPARHPNYSPSFQASDSQNNIFFPNSRPTILNGPPYVQVDHNNTRRSLPTYSEATSRPNHMQFCSGESNPQEQALTSIV